MEEREKTEGREKREGRRRRRNRPPVGLIRLMKSLRTTKRRVTRSQLDRGTKWPLTLAMDKDIKRNIRPPGTLVRRAIVFYGWLGNE